MPEELAMSDGPQLSQVSRTVNVFVAPSKTFTDILRSAACWLPLVLMIVLTFANSWAIGKTVGFETATEIQMNKNPAQAERMNALSPEDRARQMHMAVAVTKGISYAIPVFILIILALETLVLWASFNFALGARTTFPQVFAVIVFAGMPRMFISLLSIVLLFAGVGTENFDMKNPVGTNLGYYLSTSPKWLQTLGGYFDIFSIWSLILLILGMAIISKKKISQSATVIVGWWLLIILISTAASAMF